MSGVGSLFGGLFSSKPSAPSVPPVVVEPKPNPSDTPVDTGFPWLDWLHEHIGEPTVTNAKATDFDRMVFSHTSDDEVEQTGIMAAGCAAVLCAALELTGYKSTHRADAISFKNYGTITPLRPGAICVFTWDSGQHHVSVCDHLIDGKTAAFTGGDQQSKLKTSVYEIRHLSACRWPVKA